MVSLPPSVRIRGRFAPSPTGILHLGNLRTALASWLSVRARGGEWILRMEDVDTTRSRRELGEAQIRDLVALGMESDGPVLWQSERGDCYREALDSLDRKGLLYPCDCSRKDLALLAGAPHEGDGLRPYPGRCRAKAAREGRAMRFLLPPGRVLWQDLLLGSQSDEPEHLTGDPLLFRRDGCYAYHLAVVVDDGEQGVTEVVRGADLRAVTATQIRLQEALGLRRPDYAHLGLVTSSDGSRLGKRDGGLGLAALAERGISPGELLGWLGWSLGCLEAPEPCLATDLVHAFAWDRVPHGPIAIPSSWE
ncbi:MAG: tRNA glutamyl-Q(34) synthetase GluQRS [Holophagaceae bacterium]|nr:tRNA glutamyl-Q(34) synthetase GluQRS [Holophagaceae bacterium]